VIPATCVGSPSSRKKQANLSPTATYDWIVCVSSRQQHAGINDNGQRSRAARPSVSRSSHGSAVRGLHAPNDLSLAASSFKASARWSGSNTSTPPARRLLRRWCRVILPVTVWPASDKVRAGAGRDLRARLGRRPRRRSCRATAGRRSRTSSSPRVPSISGRTPARPRESHRDRRRCSHHRAH
jgi:hypothetical protein